MKKVLLIISAIFVILALIAVFCTLSACEWNFNKLLHPEVRNSYEITDEFSDIEIKLNTSEIKFVATDGDGVRVDVVEGYKIKHAVSVSEGVLKIERQDERRWYEYIAIVPVEYELTVYLPRGEWGALNIESSTGDIEIPTGFEFESASIALSTGDISFASSVVGDASFTLTTGDADIKSESLGRLAVSVSSGDIEIEDTDVIGDLNLRSSTGKTELSRVNCNALSSVGTTGDVELESVIVEGKMDVKCSTGDVKLDGADAAEIKIETGTGNVSGTLLSPKIFFAKTSTGRVDVPRSTEGGVCDITTTTGNIIISPAD